MRTPEQVSEIVRLLLEEYPEASCTLDWGKDYELLFAVAQSDYEKIKEMEGVHIIGYVTEEGMPAVMVTPQNTTIELKAQGFARQ